jgi:spore coat polysaccharide biosynthesis protein SpsF
MMLKLGEKTILEHVIDRCKLIKGIRNIVLLTTCNSEDIQLAAIAYNCGIAYACDDPPIERYRDACEYYKPDWFLRVCGDSPFMSVEMTNKLIDTMGIWTSKFSEAAGINPMEYFSFRDKKYPSITGLAPELVKTEPFLKRYAAIQEHVTYHMYDHSTLLYLDKPKELSDKYFRITIDTPEDYEFVKKVWAHFGHIPEWRELQAFVIAECPDRIEEDK